MIRRSRYLVVLCSLVLGLSVLGCGTSSPAADAGADAGDAGSRDAGPRDAGANDGGMCVPTCTIDIECQNSCPSNPAGANCCDAMLGVCYAAVTPSCPVVDSDGGMMMY